MVTNSPEILHLAFSKHIRFPGLGNVRVEIGKFGATDGILILKSAYSLLAPTGRYAWLVPPPSAPTEFAPVYVFSSTMT